jgi:hypothetical protein
MNMVLSGAGQPAASELHIVLEAGTIKVGTCEHCVVREHGRPARAWNPDGDTELDFNRDELIARLAALGVQVEITEEYVCP